MRKERKHYTAEEKVAILRRHLLDKVPVSDLCEEWRRSVPRLRVQFDPYRIRIKATKIDFDLKDWNAEITGGFQLIARDVPKAP